MIIIQLELNVNISSNQHNLEILITGSAGFIGTHLAEHYLKQGHFVTGLDNYISGSKVNTEYLKNLYPNFRFIQCDVSLPWPDLDFKNLRYLFHFASPASVKIYQKYPVETMRANSIGLQNSLDLANKFGARLIFSSTSEVYGSPLNSPQKECDWGRVNSFGPRSCYDESKRFGEALIYSVNNLYNTKHGVLRIFNTYGPRMNPKDDRVPNSFIHNAIKGLDLNVYGNGLQTRSFCYIDDLINGIVKYTSSSFCEPINLGNDQEIQISNLAQVAVKLTQTKSKIIFRDLPQDDPPQRRPDLTLARKHLGYEPQINLETGLKKMIDWVKQTT